MSSQRTERILCPNCGTEQDVSYWASINVSLDPHLRDLLFQGQINKFKCKLCEYEEFLNAPILYHDMDKQFAVQYYPIDNLDDPEFIKQFEPGNPPTIKGIHEYVGHLARPHITFNMDDLLAYIVFQEKIREEQIVVKESLLRKIFKDKFK